MPFPYVKSATIKSDNIELTLELDHPDSGSYVEVSGSATQTGGAYANFYGIKETTSDLTDPNGPHPTVNVSAHPLPPNNFRVDEDITFVIRVSKVWLTVLGPGQNPNPNVKGDGTAGEGTTWDVLRKWSHVTDGFSDEPPADTPPADTPPAPTDQK